MDELAKYSCSCCLKKVTRSLKEINESHIVGLGITKDQLNNYLELNQADQKKYIKILKVQISLV